VHVVARNHKGGFIKTKIIHSKKTSTDQLVNTRSSAMSGPTNNQT